MTTGIKFQVQRILIFKETQNIMSGYNYNYYDNNRFVTG